MPEFDLLIKGGTVVDGTRVPRYKADLAIKDGQIARMGRTIPTSSASQVLDADGLIVAPGAIDLHTHFDAQMHWDPYCTSSGWHGITTVVLGNCGFGFAPVRPAERERAMLMLARNEAMPLEAMKTAMPWDWETFPEWLDHLDRMEKGVNCVSLVPLSPLLIWTMGLEASKTRAATPEERREMQRLLGEALEAGAAGWGVQRLGEHSFQADYDASAMPTDTMADADLFALAEVLREHDDSFIQITQFSSGDPTTKGDPQLTDREVQEKLAEISTRPVLHNALAVLDRYPEFHRSGMEWLDDCNARGLRVFGMGSAVRNWVEFTLEDWNLWDTSPAWAEALIGTKEERLRKLREPALRERMKSDEAEGVLTTSITGGPTEGLTIKSVGDVDGLRQYVGRTLKEIGDDEGRHPLDVMLDVAVESDLRAEFRTPHVKSDNDELVGEMMLNPYVLPGNSDGGAHVKFFAGGFYPTDLLAWLVRETGRLTLEEAHYRLSYLPASAIGLKQRGYLREGAAADIVVYDLDRLKPVPQDEYEVVRDLPGGDWRRVSRADGYRWTIVNGQITLEDGEPAGALSGRLLRRGQAN